MADAYPGAWDEAQFAPSRRQLNDMEADALFAYDERFAWYDTPLVLLWNGSVLEAAHAIDAELPGYPRFVDAMGADAFSVSREEAVFLCVFVHAEDGAGGYYVCRAEGVEV